MRSFFLFSSIVLILFGVTELYAMGFEVHPLDESKRYLGLLFGSRVGPVALGGVSNPIIIEIFEKFNVIVMLLGIGSITYTAIGSIFSTSEEGDAMSKKYASAWLPLRAALGVLLMFPTPQSGFCLIQVGIIWFSLQAIGAANQIWGTVLDSVESGNNLIGGIQLDESSKQALTNNINDLMPEIFKTITCIESLKKLKDNAELNPDPSKFSEDNTEQLNFYLAPFDEPNTNAGQFNDENSSTPISADKLTYTKKGFVYAGAKSFASTVPQEYKDLCGRYSIEAIAEKENTSPDSDPARGELTQEAEKRFLHMYLTLNSIYDALRNFVNINIVNKDSVEAQKNFSLKEAELQIIGAAVLESSINILSALANPPSTLGPDEAIERFREIGWIHIGSSYYKLNNSNTELSVSTDLLTNKMPQRDQTLDFPTTDFLSNDEKDFLAEKLEIADLYKDSLKGFESSESSGLASITSQLPSAGIEILATFFKDFPSPDRFERLIESFKSGKEPLAVIRDFGNDLMIAGELMWAIVFTGSLASIALIGTVAPGWIMGFVFAARTLITVIITIVTSAAILFWSFGALLAIYIPMVPFLMFSIAGIGWFVAVIEAMVAGPILALGLITPTAQGSEELGKALPGVYILANIFLRPVLMVFGFILSARLLFAILTLVNTALADFLFSETGDGALYIFAFAAKVGVYAGFVVALVNRCFSLIYILPNQVLRWLGAPQEGGFGEDKILSGVQQKSQSASQASSGVLQGSSTAATQGLTQSLQQKKQQSGQQNKQQSDQKASPSPNSSKSSGGGGGGGGGKP